MDFPKYDAYPFAKIHNAINALLLKRDYSVPTEQELYQQTEKILIFYLYKMYGGFTWTDAEKSKLRKYFILLQDVLPFGLPPYPRSVAVNTMLSLSCVKVLSTDFPEIADVLKYSKQHIAVGDLFESWNGVPPITCYGEYISMKNLSEHFPDDPWFQMHKM